VDRTRIANGGKTLLNATVPLWHTASPKPAAGAARIGTRLKLDSLKAREAHTA